MTKYFKVSELKTEQLTEVAQCVRRGGTVVFKSDTVYGLGANAFDDAACRKVYDIKGRPAWKPLCVLISDLSMLDSLVEQISPLEQTLMDRFWPGPLTIKFFKRPGSLPEIVSAGDEFVRVRLVPDGLAGELIRVVGSPLIAPSANLSDHATGVDIAEIKADFDGKVDYILDSGHIADETTSTIVQAENGRIILIREGKVPAAELEKIAPVEPLQ